MATAVCQYLSNQPKELKDTIGDLEESAENDEILKTKVDAACAHIDQVREYWGKIA